MRILASIFFVILSNLSSDSLADNKTIVMGVATEQEELTSLLKIYQEFSREVFKSIGFRVKFSVAPYERILVQMDTGEIDGNVIRSKAIEAAAKNIIRVPEVLFVASLFKVVPNDYIEDHTKPAKDRVVAVSTGDKAANAYVARFQKLQSANLKHIMKLVEQKRVEFGVVSHPGIISLAKKSEQVKVIRVEPGVKLYPYLNKKHAALVQPLSQAFRNSKKSGRLKEIFRKHGLLDLYDDF